MPAASCPVCGVKFKAPDTLAGKVVRCPQCGEPVRIPELPTVRPVAEEATPLAAPKPWWRRRWVIVAAAVAAFFLIGLLAPKRDGDGPSKDQVAKSDKPKDADSGDRAYIPPEEPKRLPTVKSADVKSKKSKPSLPPVTYTVLDVSRYRTGMSLTVRISERVDAKFLKDLTLQLIGKYSRDRPVRRVFYRLPGAGKGSAWARADVDGGRITVALIGVDDDQFAKLKSQAMQLDRKGLIGCWIDGRLKSAPYVIAFYRSGRGVIEVKRFGNGSEVKTPMACVQVPQGLRTIIPNDEVYFLITPAGELQYVQPGEGVFYTAEKLSFAGR